MNTVINSYEGGVCPDCGEAIPHDVIDGASCENCGHVFYEHKQTDPTIMFPFAGDAFENHFFVVLNTIHGTKIVVLNCDADEFIKAETKLFGEAGITKLEDIQKFEFDVIGSIEVYDEINDYCDLVDFVNGSLHFSGLSEYLTGDKSWVCYYVTSDF